MFTSKFYVLRRSQDDQHVKALVNKADYPEAVEVNVINNDVFSFTTQPGLWTVSDEGVYSFDTKEDQYRKQLEGTIDAVQAANKELVENNKELQDNVNALIKANAKTTQDKAELQSAISGLMISISQLQSNGNTSDLMNSAQAALAATADTPNENESSK